MSASPGQLSSWQVKEHQCRKLHLSVAASSQIRVNNGQRQLMQVSSFRLLTAGKEWQKPWPSLLLWVSTPT